MQINKQSQNKTYNPLFPSFKKQVLKTQDISKMKREELTETVSFFTTILVLLTNVFWLIYDTIHPFIGITSRIGIILLSAVAMVYFVFALLSRKGNVSTLYKRITTDFYCIGIVISTLLMIIENNIKIENLGISQSVTTTGVGLQTSYLFILVFATFYSWVDTGIVIGSVVIAFFIPFFTPGASGYPWASHLIVRMYLALIYLLYLFLQRYLEKKNDTIECLNERLLSMSYTDSQTGAFNKRALYEYIEFFQDKYKEKEVGVFMLDLDDFKSYNDNYTHIKGDEILNSVSRAIMDTISSEKSYLFRYGGEEFVFFISKPTKEKIEELGLKVLDAVRLTKLRRTDTERRIVTITVGASIEKIEGNDKDYLFNADKNLYIGKDEGKNCVIFDGKIIK